MKKVDNVEYYEALEVPKVIKDIKDTWMCSNCLTHSDVEDASWFSVNTVSRRQDPVFWKHDRSAGINVVLSQQSLSKEAAFLSYDVFNVVRDSKFQQSGQKCPTCWPSFKI